MINFLKTIHQWFVDNVWKPSWTRLLAAIYGIPSALAVAVSSISSLAGDDKFSQLMAKIHVPDGVFVALSVVALVSYLAHGRK